MLLTGSWFTLISYGQTEDKALEKLAKSLMNNVVKIEVGQENGLGFVVGETEDSLYVITAYHVIDALEDQTNPDIWSYKIFVTFSDGVAFNNGSLQRGRMLEARDKMATDIQDFAVLKVGKPAAYTWEKVCMAPQSSIEERARVLYIDRVDGIPTPDDWGYMKQANPPLWETSIKGRMKGNSGGPMINAYGIAGMILSTERDLTRMLPIGKISEWFSTRDRSGELARAFQIQQDGTPVTHMNSAIQKTLKPLSGGVRWTSFTLGLAGLGVGAWMEVQAQDNYTYYENNHFTSSYEDETRQDFYDRTNLRHKLAQGLMIGGGVLIITAFSDKIPGLKNLHMRKESVMEGRLSLAPDMMPTYGKSGISNTSYGFSLKLEF